MNCYIVFLAVMTLYSAQPELVKPLPFISKHTKNATDLKTYKKEQKAIYNKLASQHIKSMNEKTLLEFAHVCIALEYYDEAIKVLEQLILVTKNAIIAKDARIEIADIHFEVGRWKSAEEKYAEYCTLYPADKLTDYARYKSIICLFYFMPTYDREQKTTEDIIERAEELIKKNTPYTNDLRQVVHYCHRRLYEHSVGIFNHYLKKGSFKAAQTRLEHIKKKFTAAQIDEYEHSLLHLEYKLACAQHDEPQRIALEQKLMHHSPNQSVHFASSTTKKPSKPSYVDFF